MHKIIKEFGKVLLSTLAVIVIVLIPVLISAIFFYITGYSRDIFAFIDGSFIGSFLMFFVSIFLIQKEKIKVQAEKDKEYVKNE